MTALGPPLRIRRRSAWQRRYLPRALVTAEELLAHGGLDEAAARADLDARLGWLRDALAGSPFYRARLLAGGLAPSDLSCLADLAHFPLLDRATLGAAWSELPVLDPDEHDTVVVLSSGTTGEPVRVVRDGFDTLHMWAVLRFFLRRLAIVLPAKPRVVLLDALPSGLEYSVRLPLVNDGALHRLSLARPFALERLRKARPSVIFADPAGLHWLAAQPDPPQAQLLLTSAQRFSPAQRAECARTLAAPVVNYLATTETGPLAWECLRVTAHFGERFHVLTPDVWIESVAGALAVTRLRPSVLPLLRYRTGDAGEVVRDDCACGQRGWSIVGFSGRRACLWRAPSGKVVDAWQLAWLFKPYPLDGFRLTHTPPAEFVLEIGAASVPAQLTTDLRAALERLGWPAPALEVRCNAPAPATGGKPEPFR